MVTARELLAFVVGLLVGYAVCIDSTGLGVVLVAIVVAIGIVILAERRP